MNNKITFPKLAALLADSSGRSKRFSEDFLREFFALVSERLEAGDSVKVKGIGTFRLSRVEPRKSVDVTTGQPMEISGHSKVVFIPAKELADAVNAPFEAFSAVEIADDFDISGLVEEGDILIQDDSQDILLAPVVPAETVAMPQPDYAADAANDSPTSFFDGAAYDCPGNFADCLSADGADDNVEGSSGALSPDFDASAEVCIAQTLPDVIPDDDNAVDEPLDIEDPFPLSVENENDDLPVELEGRDGAKTARWRKIWRIGAGCAVFVALVAFAIWSLMANSDDTAPAAARQDACIVAASDEDENAGVHVLSSDSSSDADTIVPTAPSDQLVYDTIGNARFLTTMAKSHYGNNKFWPYIYEENKDRIGHPDKIRPGTPIIIPNLGKFGIDPRSPEDAEKAVELGRQIYARYGKTI